MKPSTRPLLLLLAAWTLGFAAQAQTPTGFGGTWNMTVTFELPNEGGTCVYEGTAVLTQDGSAISGPTTLTVVSGPFECPAEMMADLVGTIEPAVDLINLFYVSGTLFGGKLGEASFTGSISPNLGAQAKTAVEPGGRGAITVSTGGQGTTSVPSGPFAGATGSWSAALAAAPAALAIPTATPIGLTLFVLLLIGAGTWVLGRSG